MPYMENQMKYWNNKQRIGNVKRIYGDRTETRKENIAKIETLVKFLLFNFEMFIKTLKNIFNLIMNFLKIFANVFITT